MTMNNDESEGTEASSAGTREVFLCACPAVSPL
jgi:hypothetical protein